MQPFHRLHPNRGKNILVDLDTFRSGRVYFARIYYKIGGESAYFDFTLLNVYVNTEIK